MGSSPSWRLVVEMEPICREFLISVTPFLLCLSPIFHVQLVGQKYEEEHQRTVRFYSAMSKRSRIESLLQIRHSVFRNHRHLLKNMEFPSKMSV